MLSLSSVKPKLLHIFSFYNKTSKMNYVER